MVLSIFKNLGFSENMNVQFRTESFNLSNTPQSGLQFAMRLAF